MCVDIGYKAVLDTNGLPTIIKGIVIKKEYAETDHSIPHLSAFARPECWTVVKQGPHPEVRSMRWGLIADFMIDRPDQFQKYGNHFYNARSERIEDPASAWYAYRNNRCLLIADGIYEHQKVAGRSRKMPWYIQLKTNEPLLIPALFNPRTETFAILTREGNDLFRTIHNDGPNKNRMPLLLPIEQAIEWIDPQLSDIHKQELKAFEITSSQLRGHTVYSIRGKQSRPDGKQANEAYNW